MPGALVDLLREAPMSPGKVTFAWRAAVGPALERVTAARMEGTTLVVEADGAQWAREVSRSSKVILTRVKTLLGENQVAAIQVQVKS
jgi:hypothetical protein